jgi:hypothetical protein
MKNQALVTLVVLHVSVNAPHASNIDINNLNSPTKCHQISKFVFSFLRIN